jgi:type II secretory pathway pseudopilin PulG
LPTVVRRLLAAIGSTIVENMLMNVITHKHRPSERRRRALTLIELVIVLVILVALAGLLLPLLGSLKPQSEAIATQENLRRLQEQIMNRYVPDMRGVYLFNAAGANPDGLPRATPTASPQMKYLYSDPNAGTPSAGYNASTGLGWNGPYALAGQGVYPGMNPEAVHNGFAYGTFGSAGDPTPLYAWGNPIIIVQITDQNSSTYYILLSAGPHETLGSAVSGYTGAALAATVTTANSTVAEGSTSLASATRGPTLTTSSDGFAYQYWLPLK